MPAHKPNDVIRRDGYCELVLRDKTGAEVGRAKVGEEDLTRVAPFSWCLDHEGYARNTRAGGRMHRLILGAARGQLIDHESEDKLDNRRTNIRFASQSQNIHHRARKANNKSGAIEVIWRSHLGKWQAFIGADRKRYHVGYFNVFDDAIAARDRRAIELFGDYAYANAAAA